MFPCLSFQLSRFLESIFATFKFEVCGFTISKCNGYNVDTSFKVSKFTPARFKAPCSRGGGGYLGGGGTVEKRTAFDLELSVSFSKRPGLERSRRLPAARGSPLRSGRVRISGPSR